MLYANKTSLTQFCFPLFHPSHQANVFQPDVENEHDNDQDGKIKATEQGDLAKSVIGEEILLVRFPV